MKHISIGQFSKLSGLSIRALRLYDAEHLLPPNWVDPSTGYRYYTHEQVQRANLIRRLRSAEMPLEQIQAVLQDPNAAESHLLRHRQYLEHRLRDHQEMLRTMDQLLAKSAEPEVKFRFSSAQPVLMIATHGPRDVRQVAATMFGEIYNFIQYHEVSTAGAPILTYTTPKESQNTELHYCVPIAGYPETTAPIERQELPAAELAYTMHRGSYDSLPDTLERLLTWVFNNKLMIAGPIRETLLEHTLTVPEPSRYLTEVAVPIQRSNRH